MDTISFLHHGGPKRLDLIGQRFGMLTVINEVLPSDKIATRFLCKCDCGKEKIIRGTELKMGRNKSCGCNRTPRTTYEYRDHPLYDVWKGMRARCHNPNHTSYKNYGAKGVRICKEWDDFAVFFNWAIANGYKPGLELDKDILAKSQNIKPDLYSPERCQFVTRKSNSQNRSNVKLSQDDVFQIRNSSKSTLELSQLYNIHKSSVLKIKKNKIWVIQ